MRERLAAYRETVLTAIREVEDALAQISGQKKKIEDLLDQRRSLSSGLELTRLRYEKGMISYYSVLNKRYNLLGSRRVLYRPEPMRSCIRWICTRQSDAGYRISVGQCVRCQWEDGRKRAEEGSKPNKQ